MIRKATAFLPRSITQLVNLVSNLDPNFGSGVNISTDFVGLFFAILFHLGATAGRVRPACFLNPDSSETYFLARLTPYLERLRLRGQTVASVMQTYRAIAQIVKPAQVELPAALRDPKDLHVLRCAVGATVDAIVTGDKDLLVLKEFANIPIVTPRQFLASIGM